MTMCVLHVIETSAPEAGRIGVILPGLIRALRDQGVKSFVAAADQGTNAEFDCEVCATDPPALQQAISSCELVHVHGWSFDAARTAAQAAARAKVPTIITPFGLGDDQERSRSFLGRLLRRWRGDSGLRNATTITAINDSERAEIAQATNRRDIQCLSYGIEFAEYEAAANVPRPERWPADHRCLLFLGPIDPREGLVPFLRAFAEIGRSGDGWLIVLAGRSVGDWQREIEAAVRRKGGTGRVFFEPAGHPEAQRTLLQNADLLALPAFCPRPPISLLQGLATGIPILASASTSIPQLNGAIRTHAPNKAELKERLREMLTMPDDERKLLGQRGRDAARPTFDWPTAIEPFVRLYHETAGHPS